MHALPQTSDEPRRWLAEAEAVLWSKAVAAQGMSKHLM